jgi:drug/metabolite transporter (DMT)-like permease
MWRIIVAHHARGIPPTGLLTLSAASWGSATVISKALLVSIPPITFLVIQLAPSVCVLWLLVLATRTMTSTGLLPLALLGLLNPGLSYTLSMLGLTRTTASVATLLWAAEPTLIVATAWILLRENITGRFLIATLAAACGVPLVSGIAVVGSDLDSTGGYGAMLILGGVFCCALYTVLSRRIATTIEPLSTVAIQQTVGLLWVIAIWPFEPAADPITGLLALSADELLAGALSGLMYYALAFWCYLSALRSVTATTASIFLNLTPVFGIASAYVFLGERLAPSQWIGAVTIVLSVLALLTWAAVPKSQVPTT